MKLFSPEQLSQLSTQAAAVAAKIQSKEAVVGVVGLGYVGLPIAVEFAKSGFSTIGLDVSEGKIAMLKRGENFIEDIRDEDVANMVSQGRLQATTDPAGLQAADVVYICVPTPFNANKDPDLAYILSASEALAGALRPAQVVILKSTTFPGTTEEYVIPVLEKSGLKAGRDFYVAFSPERVDPGNPTWNTANTPIVTGGIDNDSALLAAFANQQIIGQVYIVSNPRVAEMEKLLENIFRSVNIALVNEIALLCERMGGIDIWEVIEAAGTKPFGYMRFLPGPGVGGHCIPIDPYYLSWLAREFDFETRFITLAANTNESMPYHVASLVMKSIADQPIALRDARVLLVGASFKKNVKDIRNSVSEAVILRLREANIQHIDISDPWVDEFPAGDRVYRSLPLSAEMLAGYDCVLLMTDHDAFDIPFIVRHARCIIDTRNMTRGITEGREKIKLLGVAPTRARIAVSQH